MKSSKLLIALTLVVPTFSLRADELKLEECPAAVQETIRANARDGKIDDVNSIVIDGRSLFLAEIELPDDRDLKLQVGGEGQLIKTHEDISVAEIPDAVQETLAEHLSGGAKLDDIDREVADGKTTYHMEIDRPKAPDLEIVVGEDGVLISRTEDDQD